MIRVLVADDDQLFRTGLRMILDSGPETQVVGEAADGVEAVTYLRAHPGEIDVVLMDLSMPEMGGLEATRHIVARAERPRILVLTTAAPDEHVTAALRAGASGFLLKDTSPEALLTAVTATHNGTAVVSRQLTRLLLSTTTDGTDEVPDPTQRARLASLTDRELEVLRLIARGCNNTEIGEALFIAEVTVKTHVGRVIRKLGVRDRVQCVVFAYEAGLMAGEEHSGD